MELLIPFKWILFTSLVLSCELHSTQAQDLTSVPPAPTIISAGVETASRLPGADVATERITPQTDSRTVAEDPASTGETPVDPTTAPVQDITGVVTAADVSNKPTDNVVGSDVPTTHSAPEVEEETTSQPIGEAITQDAAPTTQGPETKTTDDSTTADDLKEHTTQKYSTTQVVPILTAVAADLKAQTTVQPVKDATTEESILTTETSKQFQTTKGLIAQTHVPLKQDATTEESLTTAETKQPHETTQEADVTVQTTVLLDATTQDSIPTSQKQEQHQTTEVIIQNVTTEETATTAKAEDIKTTEALPECNNDPCCDYNYDLLDDKERYMTNRGKTDSYFCDSDLQKKWYAFKYAGQWAEIPSVAIAPFYCGTGTTFRLESKVLLQVNETDTGHLCAAYEIQGEIQDCVLKRKIQIKRCEKYYVYFLQPLPKKGCSAVCTKLPNEMVPNEVLASSPQSSQPEEIPSSHNKPLPIHQIYWLDITKEQSAGIVTVEYSYPSKQLDPDFLQKFKASLLKCLHEQPLPTAALTIAPTEVQTQGFYTKKADEDIPGAITIAASNVHTLAVSDEGQNTVSEENKPANNVGGRRKRAAGTPTYDDYTVTFIKPTPRLKDGKLQMSIIVTDKDGNVLPQDKLKEILDKMENPSSDPKVPVEKKRVYVGLPDDIEPAAASDKYRDIWKAHMGLWITIIVLIIVCILTVLICCVCFRCCEVRDASPEKTPLHMEEGKKPPSVVIENPLPDEEITKDEAQMVEHENPAFTPDGEEEHLKKDEENGFVSLHQLTEAEKQKAEVENTKL